jgi:hypothetical protein
MVSGEMNERDGPVPISRRRRLQISCAEGPALNRQGQEWIGRQLRSMYDDVVGQGIPERFIALLDESTSKRPTNPNRSAGRIEIQSSDDFGPDDATRGIRSCHKWRS